MVNPRLGNGGGDLGMVVGQLQEQLGQLQDQNQMLMEQMGRLSVQEAVTEDWLQIPYRFVGLAPGATAQLTVTISGDGPFDLIEVTHTSRTTDDLTDNDNFRIRIREGEAVGRSLTINNEFVDAENTSGTAQRPYIIKGRRRFRANIAIIVEVTNFDALETLTIEVVLHGIKVFTR